MGRRRGAAAEQGGLFRSGQLYYGDNLRVLRQHVDDESIDLIYLDPPFNSNRDYNVIFKDREDSESRAQARAFDDAWTWDMSADAAFRRLTGAGAAARGVPDALTTLLEGLRAFLGTSNLLAYLVMMAERMVELRRVLKPTGSVFLHCDPTASHYLKLVLDAVFGHGCFQNEVIWRYRRWPTKSSRFQRMHDVLLFYSARSGGDRTFHTLYGYEELAARRSRHSAPRSSEQTSHPATGSRAWSTRKLSARRCPTSGRSA